jgi:hypothetical protein
MLVLKNETLDIADLFRVSRVHFLWCPAWYREPPFTEHLDTLYCLSIGCGWTK